MGLDLGNEQPGGARFRRSDVVSRSLLNVSQSEAGRTAEVRKHSLIMSRRRSVTLQHGDCDLLDKVYSNRLGLIDTLSRCTGWVPRMPSLPEFFPFDFQCL